MQRPPNPLVYLLVAIAAAWASFDAIANATRGAKSVQTPEAIYHNYCSVCHGDRGDGKSRATNSLVPPPRSFTTPDALQAMTRDSMILAVREGRPGTAMTGWKTQLTDAQIAAVVDYVRTTFMQPQGSASVKRGSQLYHANCSVCHGDQGQGALWAAGNMQRAPRNFRTPQAAQTLTRERMIAAVTHGVPGTAMTGFATQLKNDEIAAIVDFIRTAFMLPAAPGISGTHAHGTPARVPARPPAAGVSAPPPPAAALPTTTADMAVPMPKGLTGDAARGRRFYDANCATCHGVKGDGQGPRAYFIRPVPRNFLAPTARATLNRPALFAATAHGRIGTEMPAWNKVIGDQEIADVVEYVFEAFIRPQGAAAQAAR